MGYPSLKTWLQIDIFVINEAKFTLCQSLQSQMLPKMLDYGGQRKTQFLDRMHGKVSRLWTLGWNESLKNDIILSHKANVINQDDFPRQIHMHRKQHQCFHNQKCIYFRVVVIKYDKRHEGERKSQIHRKEVEQFWKLIMELQFQILLFFLVSDSENGCMHVLISLLKTKKGVLGGTKQDLEFWKH